MEYGVTLGDGGKAINFVVFKGYIMIAMLYKA